MTARLGLLATFLAGLGLAADAQTSIADLQARAKNRDYQAAYELGLRYLHGIGVAADDKEAFRQFQTAADRGKIPAAMHMAGFCYSTETGTTRSDSSAFKYYKLAADAGLAEAQFKAGLSLEQGLLGQRANPAEAARLYQLASKQGHALSQYRLARMLYEGRGVTQDYEAAADWYKRAAEDGVVEAQIEYALMSRLGQGVSSRDFVESYKWYLIAARMGHPSAVKQVEEMPKTYATYLGARQLAEARKMADQFLERYAERKGQRPSGQ
jgi:uncharacterized protein